MSSETSGNMARVLVVEDEEHLRRILVRNLERAGYQVQSAGTAASALPICEDTKPNVIVLDINLPDATGWDVLRGIAARALPRPAVIVLSAVPPVHTRLVEFGPLTFLQKPFPIQALLRAVERAAAGVSGAAPPSGGGWGRGTNRPTEPTTGQGGAGRVPQFEEHGNVTHDSRSF